MLRRSRSTLDQTGAWAGQQSKKLVGQATRAFEEATEIVVPTAKQKEAIHDPAIVRLFDGTNRGAKSFTSMLDLTYVVTGKHPVKKFDRGYHGVIYCVAKSLQSLSRIFHAKLFMPGDFDVIRDPNGKLRVYQPRDPADQARKKEKRQGPPLIPRRMVPRKNRSFYSVKDKQPKRFVIENDLDQTWELLFYTAEADPQPGERIDAAYFTEEFETEAWFNEALMRILDREGWMVLDATLHLGSDHYLNLIDEAAREKTAERPLVAHYTFNLRDNPYTNEQRVRDTARLLTNDEERRVRILGMPAGTRSQMFPEFSSRIILPKAQLPEGVPNHWTFYVAIDPGPAKAAALLMAVPDPNEAEFVLACGEVFEIDCPVERLALKVKGLVGGRQIQKFVIDGHRAVVTESTGIRIGEQLQSMFRKHGLSSVETGFGFENGFDKNYDGCELVRTAIIPTSDGSTYLRILEGACANLEWQLSHLRKKWVKDKRSGGRIYLDVPADRGIDDVFDCLRYLLGLGDNLKWVRRKALRTTNERLLEAFERRKKDRAKADWEDSMGGAYSPRVHLGPASLAASRN